MADASRFWGPVCEGCLHQYTLRPAFRDARGEQFYELFCPGCLKPLPGHAFTLQALLRADKEVAEWLRRKRTDAPLATETSHQSAG
jgi:hypothetical protein